ncbi:hypothetical protein VFPPC_12358 [Pochonia chlamydosporia 170]|uniref:Uncharacterized protein n=1 Tax=Pochonia chlamydosporia 170 TaxID=1380566 RepID=A0A179EXG3_METCM|nr:hypothetical protein VFPPC_12358 [Pochonia chlamydosporia 170]OAQ57543.1 hypothetical protein VFPPC_12358 [Pochonia chlamydosporia 170]
MAKMNVAALLYTLALAASVDSSALPSIQRRQEDKVTNGLAERREMLLANYKYLENFTLNPVDPPFEEGKTEAKAMCRTREEWAGVCMADLYQRRNLKDITRVQLGYTTKFLGEVPNDTPNTAEVGYTSAEMTSQTTTQGWSIGAKIGAPKLADGKISVELSGTYSKTWTNVLQVTDTTNYKMNCPAKHLCRIERWAFYLNLKGFCVQQPMINDKCWGDKGTFPCMTKGNCGEENAISSGKVAACTNTGCWSSMDQTLAMCKQNPDAKMDCAVETTIFENDRPKSTIALIAIPFVNTTQVKRANVDYSKLELDFANVKIEFRD